MPKIAIIGNEQANPALIPFFAAQAGIELIYVPDHSVKEHLADFNDLALIINSTNDPYVQEFLLQKNGQGIEVIGSYGNRLLLTLLEEKRKITQEAEENLRKQKEIYELGIKLNSAMSVREMADSIIACANRLTRTPAGSLVVYNAGNNSMQLVSLQGFSSGFSKVKEWPVRIGGLTDYIMQQKKPIVICDVNLEPSFDNPVMLSEGVRSVMAVALIYENNIKGILYVDDFVPRFFNEEEITELALLANQAASGLQKISLLNEISQTKDYLEAILKNSPDMIITTDQNTNIVEFNPGAETMLGYKKEEMIGKSAEILYPDYIERRQIMKNVIGQGMVTNYETKLRTKNGELLDISLSLSLLKDKEGRTIGTVGTSKNITKQKKLEAELHAANEELENKIAEVKKVDKMKSDFLSVVSHELRTPLTSILGFSKMILRRFTKEVMPLLPVSDEKAQNSAQKIKENLEIVVSEGNRLSRLINNVLDLAKIEAGKIEWNIVPCQLEEICNSAITAVNSLAEEKNLTIKTDFEPQLPEVNVDHDRLIQVVTNLLSNAIKFTDNGSVTCSIKKVAGQLEVRIIDTGIGIKPEDTAKVFEKFKQVGDTLTNRPKGTGLGLPICKEIIECHGGCIWVESEFGSGSQFAFSLKPIQAAQAITLTKLQLFQEVKDKLYSRIQNIEKGQKILVVDDEESIRKLVRQELEEAGYKVTEAMDGSLALSMARREQPDLIILDLLMPGIDGFDVMTILKNDQKTAHIPILIYSIIEDRERGYRLGAHDYVTKSAGADVLLGTVSSLMASSRNKKKKVLIIENDDNVTKGMREILEEQDYEVISARNGSEGISAAGREAPDLVIIDNAISKIDNNKILKALKQEKATENTCIIVLTDDYNSNDKLDSGKVLGELKKK
ncbi:MAG: response regulator [Candidatus Schekmanbacteria bacterium]|nr:response regulator [Candidatus Schekmanbacteria bacterium]